MPKQSSLHPPCLRNAFEHCLSCGYDLEGIPIPGQCPECGVHVFEGRSTLTITGVAKSSGGPLWRKVAWVLIGIYAFMYSQAWVYLAMGYPWFAMLGFAIVAIPIVAMAVTGKQKKRSVEQFAFTQEGFSRWTIGSDPSARIFTPWSGIKRGASVKRIGQVWATLKIMGVDETGKHTCPLETGFRCPFEYIPDVQVVLDAMLSLEPIELVEGFGESTFYAIEPADVRPADAQ